MQITNLIINIKHMNLLNALIVDIAYIYNYVLNNIYYYLNKIKINIIFIFSLINMFINYICIILNNNFKIFNILYYKLIKYLYNLNICYTLVFYRQQFSDITFINILTYTIFIINFFGNFIKDFTYINIILNIHTVFFLYKVYNNNYNINNYKNYKKQLAYITQC